MIAIPRRTRLLIVIAGLAFAAVLLLGPLNGTPWNERWFALALIFDAACWSRSCPAPGSH